MSDFIKIGNLVKSISETYKFKPNEEVIFLNTSDIFRGKVLNNTPQNSQFLPGQAKKKIQQGDLLFSEIRPANGRYAKIDFNSEKYVVSTKLMVLRCNPQLDPEYFRFFITSKEQLDYLQMLAEDRSGTFPQITYEHISNMDILLPPLPEQKAIAGVLSSLDDKIDLLHRQNKTLEAMAETLFRQWFIEEAEDDWEEYCIKDYVQHIKINVKPHKEPFTLFNHFSLPSYDNDQRPTLELGNDIKSNKYQIVNYSILVSKLNPIIPRVWGIHELKSKNSICSTEFQVIKPNNLKHFSFFLSLFKSSAITSVLAQASSGTSGSHQRVNPSDILNLSFSVPDISSISDYSRIVDGLFIKSEKNKEQIALLEKIRDLLLPKLLKGEVEIKNDEEKIN